MATQPSAPPSGTAPPNAPSRGDAPTVFRARADAFLAWIATFYTYLVNVAAWISTTATQVYNNAVEAATSAATATTKAGEASSSATAASTAANASAVSANATAWVSGGSYTAGDVRWSLLNFASYRAKTTHSGLTTDPRDDTTNWAPVLTVTQATDATFLGHTQFEAVKEKRVGITSDTTPELDVSVANVFTIETSGNTTVSVINAPSDQAWLATVTLTLGGAHTVTFAGGDWGDAGAPSDLASGDKIKVTLDGYGSSYEIFLSWRKSA